MYLPQPNLDLEKNIWLLLQLPSVLNLPETKQTKPIRLCEPGSRFWEFPEFSDSFDFPFPGFSITNFRFCQLVFLWNLSQKQFAIIFV